MKKVCLLLSAIGMIVFFTACESASSALSEPGSSAETPAFEFPPTPDAFSPDAPAETLPVHGNEKVPEGMHEDIAEAISALNEKYDALISKAWWYSNSPDMYTFEESSSFYAAYDDTVLSFQELSDEKDNCGDTVPEWDSYSIWLSVLEKNSQLETAIESLPCKIK